jgi:hypothetical protein
MAVKFVGGSPTVITLVAASDADGGAVGLVLAPEGRLLRVLRLAIADRKIAEVDVITDPAHFRGVEIAIFDSSS